MTFIVWAFANGESNHVLVYPSSQPNLIDPFSLIKSSVKLDCLPSYRFLFCALWLLIQVPDLLFPEYVQETFWCSSFPFNGLKFWLCLIQWTLEWSSFDLYYLSFCKWRVQLCIVVSQPNPIDTSSLIQSSLKLDCLPSLRFVFCALWLLNQVPYFLFSDYMQEIFWCSSFPLYCLKFWHYCIQ